MELVIAVLVMAVTLAFDIVSISVKGRVYATAGMGVGLWGLARLASDNSLVLQQQLNPSTGLYVSQTASTNDFLVVLVVMAMFVVVSALVLMVVHKEE